ncbi:MAG: hypothetical protein WDO16_22115 [Bacteroidota bacterium]
MCKRFFILVAAGLFFCSTYAQQPEQILNRWSEVSPVEKAYFHFDRNDYIAGQTVWFKAYLYSDFLPSDKSTNLFVELLNTSSGVIDRQVIPVFGGYSRGQVRLPDTLPAGVYTLRAYTAAMLNHDPDFLYRKRFYVFSKNKKKRTCRSYKRKRHTTGILS